MTSSDGKILDSAFESCEIRSIHAPGGRRHRTIQTSETYNDNSSAVSKSILIHFMMNNRVQHYLSLSPKVQYTFDSGAWLRTTFWNNLWFICYFCLFGIVQKMIHPGFSACETKALKAVGWATMCCKVKATSGQGCLGLPSDRPGTHPGWVGMDTVARIKSLIGNFEGRGLSIRTPRKRSPVCGRDFPPLRDRRPGPSSW